MCVVGVRPRVKAEGVPEAESTMQKVSPPNAEARPDDVRTAFIIAGDGATPCHWSRRSSHNQPREL